MNRRDLERYGASIPQLISRASARYGDAVAVADGVSTFSFNDVERRSNKLANALLAFNPEVGSRVALLVPNRAEFVEADFAIAKAGKVKLSINPRLVARERLWLLENSSADILIYDTVFEDFIVEAKQQLQCVKHYIPLGGEVSRPNSYQSLLDKASDTAPGIHLPDNMPSFLMYTSGTTGKPKGACSSQGSRRAATLSMLAEEIEVDPGDGMLHVGAVSHGSGSKILAYYMRGARNLLESKWDPEKFLALAETERFTGSFMVPTMVGNLIEAARSSKHDWSSLRSISYGGAPIAPAQLKEACKVLGNRFVQVYGCSEAPHPLAVLSRADHLCEDGNEARLASIGREVPSNEIRLVDAEGNGVEVGESGEMWIRGSHVMSGYWDNPEANAQAFEGSWYKTGDIARRDEQGYFYVVDRAKDMIISGGLNIYPAEVEACLHEHPAVLEVAVIGVPNEKWGESVKAVIVARDGASVSADEIISHCKVNMAGYKKPHSVVFVRELPKGATGKILKRELRDQYWKEGGRNV